MKSFIVIASLMLAIVMFTAFQSNIAGRAVGSFNDSLDKDRQKFISQISAAIKGKENMAVDSVFQNLKTLGGFPAQNLLLAMNAWSKGLGVSCGHCHNTDNFASDENPKKEIARQMVGMGNMIREKLKTINGLGPKPIVNCITCHRGELKPAFRMPEAN